jgi:metal-responsive CopG/Arc/MetJ family transcriptional regulator
MTLRMAKLVSVRVEEDLLEEIDRAGGAEGRGRSEVVREALELWLERKRIAAKVRAHSKGYAKRPVKADEFEPVLSAQRWPK